jgi:hypothetical protein
MSRRCDDVLIVAVKISGKTALDVAFAGFLIVELVEGQV